MPNKPVEPGDSASGDKVEFPDQPFDLALGDGHPGKTQVRNRAAKEIGP